MEKSIIFSILKPEPELSTAFTLSLPTLFAYFPLGIVFGILAVHLHFSWYFAVLMSAFIYGGSVQFVALGMLASHNSILAILFATLFIAMRNSFYGLSFIDRYESPWYIKIFLMFTMVDAIYALLLKHSYNNKRSDLKFCIYLNLLIYSYWVVGTFIGAVAGFWLPDFSGLAFILPCFFMTLVIENYFTHRSWVPLIIPIVASLISFILHPQNYFLLAVILCLFFIFIYHKPMRTEKS